MADRVIPILGTMTFGPQVDEDQGKRMLQYFTRCGYTEIDTAYVYNGGDSETFVGRGLSGLDSSGIRVATKVNPRVVDNLDLAGITTQLETSLDRLALDSVDTLYIHFPDPRTPLETTLEACAQLHSRGLFRALGLSNFPAWQVVAIWHLCKVNGWPLPTVYQGLYNGLSRSVEAELMPALKHHGIRFYAYNPLAGGILAGKYTSMADNETEGRFTQRPNYRNRYWKQPFFEALELLTAACAAEEIPIVQAAFRWLVHHSQLEAGTGDGVVLGASSMTQLEQNLVAMEQEPLPVAVVDAFEDACSAARSESPPYFRTSI